MLRYIAKHLAWTLVLLIGVSFVIYVLTMTTGDPAVSLAGSRASDEVIENIREQMGLNDPLFVQYPRYMAKLARGDLGDSLALYPRQSVWELLKPRLMISLSLGIPALLITYVVGIAVGVVTATSNIRWLSPMGHRGKLLDAPLVSFFLFFSAVPSLILVPSLIWLFVVKFPLLPASGWEGLFSKHAVIPLLALSLPGIVGVALLVRASVLLVIEENYIVTARAKGLGKFGILTRHVLRNALMPLATAVTASFAGLVTGFLFVEMLYGIPGMGTLLLNAIYARDFAIYIPISMLVVMLFIFGVRLADVLYTFIDPRVSLQGRGRR